MKPIGVELMLLRGRFPDIAIRPGMTLPARVLAREGAQGLIRLAGVQVAAQLPEAVNAGDRLRLEVAEVTAERLTLRIADAQPAAAPVAALPLPDGRTAAVRVEEREGGGGEDGGIPGVTVSYDSPRLGRLELRVELPPGGVAARVEAPLGEAAERAREGAEELRAALAAVTGRPATVAVAERRDPFDTYA